MLGGELVFDPLLCLSDLQRILWVEGIDEEWHLIAQALHLKEALSAHHIEQVLFVLDHCVVRHRTSFTVEAS